MASKTKKGTPAPTSKKPVVRRDGKPTRAEKSLENKATYAASTVIVNDIRNEIKDAGKSRVLEAGELPPFTEWTPEVEKKLYELIGTGHSMREISKMSGMPKLIDMLTWLMEETHPFSKIYTRARQAVTTLYEEEIQRLGMNAQRGKVRTERQVLSKDGDVIDTVETRYMDNVERSKLAVATLQWTLSHLKPKKHGRNPDPTTNGANEQLKGLFDALMAGPVSTPGSKP